jgi:hypothetical protein
VRNLPGALCPLRAAGGVARWLAAVLLVAATTTSAWGEVDLPSPDPGEAIVVAADAANRWTQGEYEVWLLRGRCSLKQGLVTARSDEAVLWIERAERSDQKRNMVIAYLEGGVQIDYRQNKAAARLAEKSWLGTFYSTARLDLRLPNPDVEPEPKPPIYLRGMAQRNPFGSRAVRQAQYAAPGAVPGATPPQAENMPPGTRRLRAFPRGDVPVQVDSRRDPATNEQIAVIESGVTLLVDGLPNFGSIDVSTDRMVIWTTGMIEPDLSGQSLQSADMPLELYLEGNIVFRQGERVIYADRMYYDVKNHRGTVLDGEMLTPVRQFQGLVRLRAEVLRQTGEGRFSAENAFLTSSRFGQPGYRLQAGNIEFEDLQSPEIDPATGQPRVNPETGEPLVNHDRRATSYNNFLFVEQVPVFYWPVISTNLEEPSFYLRRAQFKNDNVFGTQVLTDWNAYQLLGIRNPPAGTDWDVSFDYLSKRGPAAGTTFAYNSENLFDVPGPYAGFADFWAVDDHGHDNLGSDRRDLVPAKNFRDRLLWRHREQLPADFQLSAEAGWISDRNFLEEYFKNEWDEFKDESTDIELKRLQDNTSWSVRADARINRFFTDTTWLPRADHFWLGQPLLADTFTWYEHSQVGYARYGVATRPTDPNDKFSYLPWEVTNPFAPPLSWQPASAQGERLVTRQEIDLPFPVGPVKVVPYALGELAHWGDDLTGEDLQRAYGQVGVRASMPVWAANPAVESTLFNVHGIAHKMVFETEVSFADSNRDLSQLPLYDPLDDNSVEQFRRRFAFNTFGTPTVPVFLPQFDPRSYALRSGIAGSVTSPTTEVADDLAAVRLGLRQRWQTKRGPAENRRIIDWVVLDTRITWFPNADRDNFGQQFGLAEYDFRWHVGDRLTLLSDGEFDFFDLGQRVMTVGGFLNHPPRGSLYLGFRSLEGPINSQVLLLSYNYWMSPKWISSFGTSYDFGDRRNIGQHLALTRIGESFLVSLGFNVDTSRDSFGVNLAVEPRFLSKTRLGGPIGSPLPAAGDFGLE